MLQGVFLLTCAIKFFALEALHALPCISDMTETQNTFSGTVWYCVTLQLGMYLDAVLQHSDLLFDITLTGPSYKLYTAMHQMYWPGYALGPGTAHYVMLMQSSMCACLSVPSVILLLVAPLAGTVFVECFCRVASISQTMNETNPTKRCKETFV